MSDNRVSIHHLLRRVATRLPAAAAQIELILRQAEADQVPAIEALHRQFPARELQRALMLLRQAPRPPPSFP